MIFLGSIYAISRVSRFQAIKNEEIIKSINEDWEASNAEWAVLCEQERTGLDTANTVKNLTSELSERQNHLARVIETTNQMLIDMNEENNRQIEVSFILEDIQQKIRIINFERSY